ncbi:hypothetical protein GOODEAATRI_007577, partial [Goodea atripinnis]
SQAVSSLPGTPGGDVNPANSVLSWAVSFEKLLEDPCGVAYFTAFLKSEVSAENILFWQECEKFRKIPATSLDQLMKMDSYRRFVRSPLYQRCTLASVEGIHLPQLSTEPVSIGSWEDMVNRSPPSDKKVNKIKHRAMEAHYSC